ncbi:MAG: carboxylate--amine ligase [Acidobacteria bacterium]|nr:MAG: carboxylate--amine ligase [Acidobacteriota bacterium]
MLTIKDTSTPVIVLRSDSHGGLNIMRSLGRLGVAVYNVDPNPWVPAFQSRYCKGKCLWDIEHRPAEETLECLSEFRRAVGRPCVMIPTTDWTARFVAEHVGALAESFIFPQQAAGLVHSLACKREMFYLARRHNIPTPDAAFPRSREDVLAFLEGARFPVMLKGIDGQRLWERTGKKMFIVRTEDELLKLYDAAEDFQNPNLMLQEYIPGGDDTIWMFNGYFNGQSDCLVGFTGKKIRQCPIHRGSTSLGICLANRTVDTTTRRFMKAIGYKGALDIGFRYDARDGQYKVLDINPRIGATFRLFVGENGTDVARALYLDLTGQEVVPSPAKEGRKWIVEDLDIVSSYRYYREGHLGFKDWIRSFRGIREAAFICSDDPLPVAAMLVSRTAELIRRTFRVCFGKARAFRPDTAKHGVRPSKRELSSRQLILNFFSRKTGS